MNQQDWALALLAYVLLVAWLQVRVHRHARRAQQPRTPQRSPATRVLLTATPIGD